MTHAEELIDEAWGLHVEVDDTLPLWSGELDQIERWFTSSSEATSDVRARCDEVRARLEAAIEDAPARTCASLLTAAAMMRADAWGAAAPSAELTWPHADEGFLGLMHWATNSLSLTTAEHGDRYHEKMRRLPGAVDELCARLEEAAEGDRAPIRRHVERAIGSLDELLGAPVADDPFLAQPAPTEVGEASTRRFSDGVAALVESHTRPALARLRETLADSSLPAARDDDRPGLLHRPDGEAEYAEALAAHTRPGLDAGAIHAIGLEQLARLDGEWARYGQQQFGVSDPSEVRRCTASLPGRTSADEVKRDAEAIFTASEAEAPKWFNRVPESTCEIRTTVHGSLAFYSPPKPELGHPARTYFNVQDPTAWGPQLAATTVHEGIPGHHYQAALALEDQSLHEMHRRLFLTAFGEGWALYVEQIGMEMGLYPTTIDLLGMLQSDALRATRLVVDTGLHAMGWTRQHAIDTMVERTALGLSECTAEVDRYIAMPGQATSYTTGRLAIERLRDDADRRLGNGFDIAAFHDVVLSNGMLSLDALESLVEDWVTTDA